MTSIASPRDSSVNGRRIPLIATPTSSSRPSLEVPRSETNSPAAHPPRRNRAALREYYNLKATRSDSDIPAIAESDTASILSSNDHSEVAESELDSSDFNPSDYIKHVLETQSLQELLRTYNGVLTDIRALDAEKKALVYDNYSKLIAATETIRKMRANMDPLNPMASTLDPAIARVYERADAIKRELKGSLSEAQRRKAALSEEEKKKIEEKTRVRDVVNRVLEMPEKVRRLVGEGKEDEATREWEITRRLLLRWRERGVGGEDVQICIEDGDAALRGEPPSKKSWVNRKR